MQCLYADMFAPCYITYSQAVLRHDLLRSIIVEGNTRIESIHEGNTSFEVVAERVETIRAKIAAKEQKATPPSEQPAEDEKAKPVENKDQQQPAAEAEAEAEAEGPPFSPASSPPIGAGATDTDANIAGHLASQSSTAMDVDPPLPSSTSPVTLSTSPSMPAPNSSQHSDATVKLTSTQQGATPPPMSMEF
jgi:single-stranded DNA-binding protein